MNKPAVALGFIFTLIMLTGSAGAITPETGTQWVNSLSLAEWMGPLAPIALSPFFGLMCLSGAALLIDQGLLPHHPLLHHHPVLGHQGVFIALAVLTLITSLPRLTKVTKPLTQIADLAETYAGILVVIILYAFANSSQPETASLPFAAAGLADTGSLLVIAIVSAINILVIQTVRLFFELLVLLSPIPLLDALFEAANKFVCLVLTAIYIFHPAAALAVNLFLFLLCAILVKKVHRRLVSFRRNVLWPMWRKWRTRAKPA
ncbi:MAG TPA: hypothetical protein PKE55_13710 [Kiritimatiellia bacterium]|nr:hypothetical protein [Kiritimatiellia bacterium]